MYSRRKTDLILEISTIENPKIDISQYLKWYLGLSPPALPPIITPRRALGGFEVILKAKLTSFLKSPLLKILELIYHIIFCGI